MNIIRVYKLLRLHQNPSKLNFNWKINSDNNFKTFRRISILERNLFALILRKCRADNPFQPKDFSESKKLYDEYFQMEGHIGSYRELIEKSESRKSFYVTKFRNGTPVKGDTFASYYTNVIGCGGKNVVYKLGETDGRVLINEERWIKLNGVGENYASSIDSKSFTSFRYSTNEEISDYKLRIIKLKELNKQIANSQKEITRLYSEVTKIKQFKK